MRKAPGPIGSLVAVLVVLGSTGRPVSAAGPPEILSGIDEIHVRMDHLSGIVTESGLGENNLLVELANPLRDAGLLVLPAGAEDVLGPVLVLTLETIELPTGDLALHAALELREEVAVERLPGVLTLGSTWYSSIFTVSPRPDLVRESRAIVSALAAQFLGDRFATTAP